MALVFDRETLLLSSQWAVFRTTQSQSKLINTCKSAL